jgi:hypothetical protein
MPKTVANRCCKDTTGVEWHFLHLLSALSVAERGATNFGYGRALGRDDAFVYSVNNPVQM